MGGKTQHVSLATVLALAGSQHGVVTREQLLELGMTAKAIEYRVRRGRLHRIHRGVYAVGRPQLTRIGVLHAAVLSAGPGAALSHESAAELLGIRRPRPGPIEVTATAARRRTDVRIHRRALGAEETTRLEGIAVTTAVRTLADLSARLGERELEAAVNEADRLDLVDPERLREALEERRGARALRRLLDRRSFRLTDSELERRFLRIAAEAGLPPPLTRQRVNGFRVDFFWPELGLVVETDGLRYHRTPAQQARDRLRDQAHAAAGLTPLRFTYAQVAFEAVHVKRVLASVAAAAERAAAAGRPTPPPTAPP